MVTLYPLNYPAGNMRFKVVIPSYNSADWLPRTLRSVARQRGVACDVVVIDDASTDPRQRPIVETFCRRQGWTALLRDDNRGALANIVAGVRALDPDDEDVIVLVDGDDWLAHPWALRRLARVYDREPVTVTWGQYVTWPGAFLGCSRPLPAGVIDDGRVREAEWSFSHLRTFKHHLWAQIRDADLRGPDGDYFRTAWDLAIMFPLIEMAGHSARYVHDILYVYNGDNPLNDHKVHGRAQLQTDKLIRAREPYPRRIFARCDAAAPNGWPALRLWLDRGVRRLGPKLRERLTGERRG